MFYKKINISEMIEQTFYSWERANFALNDDIKIIFQLTLKWIFEQGRHKHIPFYDFIYMYLPNYEATVAIIPWVRFNLEALINHLHKNKLLTHSTHTFQSEWSNKQHIRSLFGKDYVLSPIRVNYQIAIYINKQSVLNHIVVEQINHFLSTMKHPPLGFIILRDECSALFNIDKHININTDHQALTTLSIDALSSIRLTGQFKHIPCVVFGSHKLNFSQEHSNVKCYPSYQDVCAVLADIKISLEHMFEATNTLVGLH